MTKVLLLVIAAEFWITIGQICFKKSADRLNRDTQAAGPWIKKLLHGIFRYPVLWLGAVAMAAGLLFWFTALARGDLSLVYLLGSIQYIFALIAAKCLLGEAIDVRKLAGTLLIVLGIILTALC